MGIEQIGPTGTSPSMSPSFPEVAPSGGGHPRRSDRSEQGWLQLEARRRDHEGEAACVEGDGHSVDEVRPSAQGRIDLLEAVQVATARCEVNGRPGRVT